MQCMQSRDIVVRLSVNTGIVFKRIGNTVTLLGHSGKGTILVFKPHRRFKISREPLSGGVKYMGCENFANITLYLGNDTRQTHIVTMKY